MTDVPPLAVVALLFHAKSQFTDLPHVVDAVSLFLDSSVELPLAEACKRKSIKLLDRIWVSSEIFAKNADFEASWTLRKYIRTDKNYRQFLFNEALQVAVKDKSIEMVKWLSSRFQGCDIHSEVLEEAAGNKKCLQFFLENDSGSLQQTSQIGHRVEWDEDILSEAVLKRRGDIVWWLKSHLPNVDHDMNFALECAVKKGDILSAKWLLSQGAEWSRLDDRDTLAQRAAAKGQLDILQWLNGQKQVKRAVGMVVKAAEHGRFDVVKWLFGLYPQNSARSFVGEAVFAIHIAAVNGNLQMAKYLRAHTNVPTNKVQHALQTAEHRQRLRKLSRRLGLWSEAAALVSGKTMEGAAKNGHLDVVKWLYAEFGQDPDIHLFHHRNKRDTTAMDAAAGQGHLEVVQYLHELQVSIDGNTNKRKCDQLVKRPSPKCSTMEAMNQAATNGFLEVIKWLHTNRSEGCSTDAMDNAATNGHLQVVQWLAEHRSEGCTSNAMDGAARHGYLEVVKWLHINRSAGCTTSAMDDAAANGHLEVVQWIHAHRSEGCTHAAMDRAAHHNQLNVIKWLHRNRAEGCTLQAMDDAAEGGHLQVVEWLHKTRSESCSAVAMCGAAERGNFEVLLFLYSQGLAKCTAETLAAARVSSVPEIQAWVLNEYPALDTPVR